MLKSSKLIPLGPRTESGDPYFGLNLTVVITKTSASSSFVISFLFRSQLLSVETTISSWSRAKSIFTILFVGSAFPSIVQIADNASG